MQTQRKPTKYHPEWHRIIGNGKYIMDRQNGK